MTSTSAIIASTAASLGIVAVAQDLPAPQQWTVLGLLAIVVLGGGKMLVQGVVKAIKDLGEDQRENTRVLAGLLTEIKLLSQLNTAAHADYARERDRAVAELKGLLTRMPEDVANRIKENEG